VDSNVVVAIVTSVSTAASTAGVAITALLLSNKRIDRLEVILDRNLERINVTLKMLTGSLHHLDKRLSIIEDCILRDGK
jgi:hypothetical protein